MVQSEMRYPAPNPPAHTFDGVTVPSWQPATPMPVHITVTKNTKGYNYEVSAHGATVDDTLAMVDQAMRELKRQYGE